MTDSKIEGKPEITQNETQKYRSLTQGDYAIKAPFKSVKTNSLFYSILIYRHIRYSATDFCE